MFDIGPEIHYLGFFAYFLVIILGVVLGSFLNSWIWRRRENIRIAGNSRSICIHCHRVLLWYENIPFFSYIIQRGKCRCCHKEIPFHYFLVELITPILLVVAFFHCANSDHFSEWRLLRNIFFLSFLIIIFKYDWLYREIPTDIVWAGAILGLAINYFSLNKSLWNLLLASAVMGGFFLLQYLVSHGKWIGGGDVRLGFMFGFWIGWPRVVLALLIAYVLGAVVGMYLLATKKADRRSELPFATFLSISVFACLMIGSQIVEWYTGLLK